MTLNTCIIYVAFPALILSRLHGPHLRPDLLLSVMMPWLMFLMGAALFWTVARYLDLPPNTTGALMQTGGLGNTSFVGLPIIEALSGPPSWSPPWGRGSAV
jgi:predicted permease